MSTKGRYGAVNTSSPRKLSLVSGFFLPQMYTRLAEREEPRNGRERNGDARRSIDVA